MRKGGKAVRREGGKAEGRFVLSRCQRFKMRAAWTRAPSGKATQKGDFGAGDGRGRLDVGPWHSGPRGGRGGFAPCNVARGPQPRIPAASLNNRVSRSCPADALSLPTCILSSAAGLRNRCDARSKTSTARGISTRMKNPPRSTPYAKPRTGDKQETIRDTETDRTQVRTAAAYPHPLDRPPSPTTSSWFPSLRGSMPPPSAARVKHHHHHHRFQKAGPRIAACSSCIPGSDIDLR